MNRKDSSEETRGLVSCRHIAPPFTDGIGDDSLFADTELF